MTADPLEALRPLHAPPPVSWWPPAPGWWIVLLIIIVSIIVFYRYRHRMAPQRAALQELKLLRKNLDAIDHPVVALNQLLKRYALICWPKETVASLSGEDWLVFLDDNGGNGKFSAGPGQLLLSGPYQQHCPDINALIDLTHHWIKTNKPQKKTHGNL